MLTPITEEVVPNNWLIHYECNRGYLVLGIPWNHDKQHFLAKGLDTHNANSRRFWRREFVAISHWIHSNVISMVPFTQAVFFRCKFMAIFLLCNFFTLYPFYRAIFCVATGLTAVCFTTCMIQHMLSILIFILINLPWIEGKQQQHCFSIEGKSIVGIGYTQ